MKKLILFILIFNINSHLNSQPIISENGYPEHVIVGAIVGGGVSYFVFKKTDDKLLAWTSGVVATVAFAFLKEALDPTLFNGVNSVEDITYSVVGGAIGASIVFPLNFSKKKKKRRVNKYGYLF